MIVARMESSTFKRNTCLLILLGLLVVVGVALAVPQQHANDETQPGHRWELRIFNFAHFKKTFNKHYPSIASELVRCQIFLADACKVFTDWISFRSGKSSSFSSINEMSDWDSKEVRQMYSYRGLDDHQSEMSSESVAEDRANLAEVERKLDEIVENRNHDGVLAEIATDITQTGNLNEILLPEVGEPEQVSDKLVRHIASNNPQYEAPELLSQGAGDEDDELEPPVEVDKWQALALDWTTSGWQKAAHWIYNNFAYHDKHHGDKKGALDTPGDAEERAGKNTEQPKRNTKPDKVYVDHRTSGCITPVRRQGRCGSCYIFSAIAILEYHHCMQTGSLVEFSEQFPVDCGARMGLKGCQGGQERHVIEFTQEYGLELRSNYPYVKRQEECPYPEHMEPESMGYLKTYDLEYSTIELAKVSWYLRKQPVMIGVYVGDVFKRYAGGIDSGEFCEKGKGHAMLLLGRGRENGQDYWLFKNSHGTRWGEQGYYRLNRKTGAHCLMGKYAWIIDRAFADTDKGLWVNPIYEAEPVQERLAKNKRMHA